MRFLLQKFDNFVARHSKWAIAFLLIFYFISKAPEAFMITGLDWPFDALYIAKKLLFSSMGLNPELSKVLVVSANPIFIYPAGYFMLVHLLGSIQNMQTFFFIIQALVSPLLFKIFRSLMSAGTALLLALFLGHYSTSPAGFSPPDYMIQPLLLLTLLLLGFHKTNLGKISLGRIAMGGFLIGVATVLKHPIGIFFVLAVFTLLFFRSTRFAGEPKSGKNRFFLFFFILGLLGSGVIFLTRSIHLESTIYFLVPYFSFWILMGYFFIRNKAIGFDLSSYGRKASVLALSFLILPGAIFLPMGRTVGFHRYWYSLFGMNFNSLARYDRGISQFIQEYFAYANLQSLRGIYYAYMGFLLVLMVIFPFLTNTASVLHMLRQLKKSHLNPQHLRHFLELASLGMVGIFTMFPLDGKPILVTKLFLFCVIFFYSTRKFSLASSTSITHFFKVLLIAVTIPVFFLGFSKPFFAFNTETAIGSELVHQVVGLRLKKNIDDELEKQIEVINRSVQGHDYFIVDEYGTTDYLMAFIDNPRPQYYLFFPVYAMNQEATNKVIDTLRTIPFIIVNTSDLEKYSQQRSQQRMTNPYLTTILDFVMRHCREVDRYESSDRIHDFIVMKNKEI